ncbi:Serine/threonine-protein phosphatase 4 regulatory subunit 1 [Actinomortierella ambigua]|nr:Serine/threonine-protein phosphatase 4 regulatory subunit 1 [Actinomortierella ambigua]
MADLGVYFGDDDTDQLEQEDKALEYLELSNEQDDTFDPVDTENLLAQMSSEAIMSGSIELDDESDVVQLLDDPALSATTKAQILARSAYEFHRAFLAREFILLLSQMEVVEAITNVIPILRDLSLDSQDVVRETLAGELDKIILYFFQHTAIDHSGQEISYERDNIQRWTNNAGIPLLAHDTFTPIITNLLLDQVAATAHQARAAVVSVAENVSEELLESEILGGVIAGLEKMYKKEQQQQQQQQQQEQQEQDSYQQPLQEEDVEMGDCGGVEEYAQEDEGSGEAELGKMLVVMLMTSLAKALGPYRCTDLVIPLLEKFMHHSQFYVRKEIVTAIGALCENVPQEVVVQRLLPMLDSFVRDDTWHIRRACCTVLAAFVRAMPAEMRAEKVEEVYGMLVDDVSRTVQNSIMEVLGEVIAAFDHEQVPESILQHFLDMGKQPMNQPERAVMCAFSFPAVILTAGRSKWELMKPVYMRLAGTFRSPIRRSLACSLHEVARILGPELTDRDLAVAFADCLVAEDEVKEGVLGRVVEFISCLSLRCRTQAVRDLRGAWFELVKSSNWRLRDSLAGQLPGLCEVLDAKTLKRELLPLAVLACTDGVSTIRESGVMSFPALWEASDRVGPLSKADLRADMDVDMADTEEGLAEDEATPLAAKESEAAAKEQAESSETTTIKEYVMQQTAEFAIHGGFRSRVVAVQIIQSLLDSGIAPEEFETTLMSLLVDHLGRDSVVNVRIWVARVVSWIIESGYYGDDIPVSPRILELQRALQMDLDRDVRIYAGGPFELPKPVKKDKKKKKKKKSSKKGQRATSEKNGEGRVYLQNPKDGEYEGAGDIDIDVDGVVGSFGDDGPRLHFGQGDREDESESSSSCTDSEEDDDEEDEDEDEDGSEGDEEQDEAGKAQGDSADKDTADIIGRTNASRIANKPRNRNSMGAGMKMMAGDKLMVGGKEIRRPRTTWDFGDKVVETVEEEESEETETDAGDLPPRSFDDNFGNTAEGGNGGNGNGNSSSNGNNSGSTVQAFDDPTLVHEPLDDEETTMGGDGEPWPHSSRSFDTFDQPDKVGDKDTANSNSDNHNPNRQGIREATPYQAHAFAGASPLDVETGDGAACEQPQQQHQQQQAVKDDGNQVHAVVTSQKPTEPLVATQENSATPSPPMTPPSHSSSSSTLPQDSPSSQSPAPSAEMSSATFTKALLTPIHLSAAASGPMENSLTTLSAFPPLSPTSTATTTTIASAATANAGAKAGPTTTTTQAGTAAASSTNGGNASGKEGVAAKTGKSLTAAGGISYAAKVLAGQSGGGVGGGASGKPSSPSSPTVSVAAAQSDSESSKGTTGSKERQPQQQQRSPEEEVLRVLNAKLQASAGQLSKKKSVLRPAPLPLASTLASSAALGATSTSTPSSVSSSSASSSSSSSPSSLMLLPLRAQQAKEAAAAVMGGPPSPSVTAAPGGGFRIFSTGLGASPLSPLSPTLPSSYAAAVARSSSLSPTAQKDATR